MSGVIWIIVGGVLLLLLTAVYLVRLSRRAPPVLLVSREGQIMMEVSRVGYAEGQLVVKGRLMGAMPATILIQPEEAWKALGLLGARVIVALPWILLVGWWRCLKLNWQAK